MSWSDVKRKSVSRCCCVEISPSRTCFYTSSVFDSCDVFWRNIYQQYAWALLRWETWPPSCRFVSSSRTPPMPLSLPDIAHYISVVNRHTACARTHLTHWTVAVVLSHEEEERGRGGGGGGGGGKGLTGDSGLLLNRQAVKCIVV